MLKRQPPASHQSWAVKMPSPKNPRKYEGRLTKRYDGDMVTDWVTRKNRSQVEEYLRHREAALFDHFDIGLAPVSADTQAVAV